MGRSGRHSIPAVLVGLDCITGLQSARILSARGVPVIGIAENPRHFACRTRRCTELITSSTRTEALIETLERLGRRLDEPAVLIPCTDLSVLQISRYRERLAPYFRFGLPRAEVVEQLLDKVSFFEFACQHDLPIPETYCLTTREQAEEAARRLRYPCILKPPVKTPKWEANTKIKAYKPASAREFLETYDQCSQWSDTLLAQEWVEGTDADLYSCNCYYDANSQVLVFYTSKKIRQWPPETGISSLSQECRNDELREIAQRLFAAAQFHGLGYVEVKRHRRTGKLLIIEPNIGRPTGRSAIAEAGGVELLYTAYCDLLHLPLPEARQQQYRGVKWIYWRQDLRSALHYWRRGELSFGQWLSSVRGRKTTAVLSWSDPLPFLADLWSAWGKSRSRPASDHATPEFSPSDAPVAS